MPTWVKVAIDAWATSAGVTGGHVFRPVNRGDRGRRRMGEKIIWQLLQTVRRGRRVAGIAPHDLRRTTAKLCRAAGGELEQIQLLLGHRRYRRPSGTSARSRIWSTRRMMVSKLKVAV